MNHAGVSTHSLLRPRRETATFLRFAVGVIWLAGAAWNALVTWRMSDPYGWLAEDAGLAPWRWFFSEAVEKQPEIWTALLVAGEIALGLLTLASERWARLGLVGGAFFSILLLSFGTPYTLMMGPYALLLIWISLHDMRHSVLDLVRGHR